MMEPHNSFEYESPGKEHEAGTHGPIFSLCSHKLSLLIEKGLRECQKNQKYQKYG